MSAHAPFRRLVLFALLLVAAVLTPLWLLRRFPVADLQGPIASRPLAPGRTAPGPRFRLVPPSESGLAFTNELRPENTFTYLTNGAGMAVGDYDRDGLPDVYLVSQDGPNKLFRQVAPLRFADVTAAAGNVDGGQAWGTGATFVDIDDDGFLDLYVCNMEAKNKLYRNRGDGTFEECAARFGLDIAAASTMAAFADYDRDGDLDLFLLTNRALHASWALTPEVLQGIRPPAETVRAPRDMVPTVADLQDPRVQRFVRGENAPSDGELPPHLREHFFVYHGRLYMAGQPDRLLRNDGGRFTDVTAAAGIHDQGMGLSATFWDYDQDGWPDLYVANDLESPDTLWHNEGNGTFRDVTARCLPHTAYYGMGSDSGDVDNDGRLDFFVGDMSATTHRMAKILMGDMTAQRDFLIHAEPQQYMRNALLLNTGARQDGDVRFQEAAFQAGVASTDWTWSTLLGDLDGDGKLDLFCTNGIARFDMNPDINLRVKELWREGRQQEAIAQILAVPKVPERNLALRNDGDLARGEVHFSRTGADWGLDQAGISHGAVLCDLDRDGDLDVITNNWNEPASLFENLTSGVHALEVELRGSASNRSGIGARVEVTTAGGTQVRENWLARGYFSGQEPRVAFGLGGAARVQRLVVRWPSGQVQEFTDLAADRLYTIREPAATGDARPPATPPAPGWFQPLAGPAAPQFRHRERPFDDFAGQFLLPHKLSQLGPGLAFGDADGDGDDDLFVGGAAGQAGAMFVREDSGWRLVDGPWAADAECEDMGVLWFDYDGDGDQDLLVVSGGVEAPPGDARLLPRLYRNEGSLHFVRDLQALPDLRESGSSCCAADIDLDGDLDLFLGGRTVPGSYPDAPPSRLLRNDGGRFTDVTAECAPALLHAGMVTGAVFAGISGDPYPDLLVAAQWQPVRYLRNDAGKGFVDATADAGLEGCKGWWNGILALDADGDGDTDFVVGNQGRNTKYKATREHPAGLLFGDFDDNGTRDLVETKYEGDDLLPVRGRSCSSQAMPFVAAKFPTYEQFASSLLRDIYPQEKLQAAGSLQADCLDSVLLRNDGEGRFTVVPLPFRAQFAPLYGLCAQDFDGDGREDLVAGTNFFAPEPETGHFDGGLGLLLRGHGDGLSVVPPAAAGIVLFADQKGVASADLDGDGRPDVAIACNDAPLACWRNAGGPAMLAVRLQGPPGNPTGVGAVVGVQRQDGTGEHRTVRAGDGYLSQSSATQYFARAPSPITAVVVVWPDGTDTRVDQGLEGPSLVVRRP